MGAGPHPVRGPHPLAVALSSPVKMVFHRDPLGIASSISVYILLCFGDYALAYHVLEYGKHEG